MNEGTTKKRKARVTITEVSEWTLDDQEWAGLASHVGDHDTRVVQINEEEEKTESDAWNTKHLPFSFDAEISVGEDGDWDEDEVDELCLNKLNEHADLCAYDLYKAEACEYDVDLIEEGGNGHVGG